MAAPRSPARRAFTLGALSTVGLAACMTPRATPPDFAALRGWADEDFDAARAIFLKTVDRLKPGGPVTEDDWSALRAEAARGGFPDARAFFETLFTPLEIGGGPALMTGYFEPEYAGARQQGGPYQYPIHTRPRDLGRRPYFTNAQIMSGALQGRGLELFWLTDPADGFFLQIQGSGRILLPDGQVARVGYAGQNGRPYYAIGRSLVERGEMSLETVSMAAIRDWIAARPVEGRALMALNQSYVFFKERPALRPDDGPVGALSTPLTAGRSVAVDPSRQPLGAPLWIETPEVVGPPARRLWIAQDTGGAIKGAQRADLFLGSGDEAGRRAGGLRAEGRMITLVPRATARRLGALA